jgi:hypothetical protein
MDDQVSRTIECRIGGAGKQIEIPVTIVGCECRADDFTSALVGFTNQWKADADAFDASKVVAVPQVTKKPCGCK